MASQTVKTYPYPWKHLQLNANGGLYSMRTHNDLARPRYIASWMQRGPCGPYMGPNFAVLFPCGKQLRRRARIVQGATLGKTHRRHSEWTIGPFLFFSHQEAVATNYFVAFALAYLRLVMASVDDRYRLHQLKAALPAAVDARGTAYNSNCYRRVSTWHYLNRGKSAFSQPAKMGLSMWLSPRLISRHFTPLHCPLVFLRLPRWVNLHCFDSVISLLSCQWEYWLSLSTSKMTTLASPKMPGTQGTSIDLSRQIRLDFDLAWLSRFPSIGRPRITPFQTVFYLQPL